MYGTEDGGVTLRGGGRGDGDVSKATAKHEEETPSRTAGTHEYTEEGSASGGAGLVGESVRWKGEIWPHIGRGPSLGSNGG